MSNAFANAGTPAPEKDFGGFLKPKKQGEAVVGHIVGLKHNQYGRYFVMQREDGTEFNVSVPTYVENNHHVDQLVGKIVALVFEDTIPIEDQPNDLHRFGVYTFDAWADVPERGIEAELDAADLPF